MLILILAILLVVAFLLTILMGFIEMRARRVGSNMSYPTYDDNASSSELRYQIDMQRLDDRLHKLDPADKAVLSRALNGDDSDQAYILGRMNGRTKEPHRWSIFGRLWHG